MEVYWHSPVNCEAVYSCYNVSEELVASIFRIGVSPVGDVGGLSGPMMVICFSETLVKKF
jgi:hypothetical protein